MEGVLYLHALSKSNSKREVADKLGISVDTLNKYISDLESELKTIFFTSSGRGTTVTPEGERLLKMSEQIIKLVKSLSIFEDMANNCKGTVRLSMPDTIACYLGMVNMVNLSILLYKFKEFNHHI
ncbi:MAG: LysR family transcriptional regulator [Alphaproteobacteria bacterium]|nr:LysR family transcriptional regulator [Alphaproteobacteria bacterium]